MQLFGATLPIIQAPMAGAQASALAIAVTNAGGLGSLPCALLDLEQLRQELAALQAAARGPVNVNFFCHQPPAPDTERDRAWRGRLAPYYRELGVDLDAMPASATRMAVSAEAVEVLGEFRPAVVSFHFGLPSSDLVAMVKAMGARVLASATTVDEARWLVARGVDAVIAQGIEAGGHRGHFLSDDLTRQLGTLALVPQIVRAVDVPVVAAGGIADARGVRAALALGAAAVQVGTAYLFCPEAAIGPLHRAALGSDAARHTALTNVFTGRPARAIVNRFVREQGPLNPAAPAFPLASAAVQPLRARAEALGSADFSPLWAGQGAPECREMAAADLTRALAAEL